MKIGIYVITNRGGGGTFQYEISLLDSLKKFYSEEVVIFIDSLESSAEFRRFISEKWTIQELPFNISPHNLLTKIRTNFYTYLSKNNLDLIRPSISSQARDFFKKQNIELMIYCLQARFAPMWGIPYIMPVHDLQHRLQPEFPEVSSQGEWLGREQMFRNAIRYAQGILVDSDVGKEDVLNFYGDYISANRVYSLPFVPAYIPNKKITEAEKIAVKNKYLLPDNYIFYPAQFWLHKNHARLVHAIHQIRVTHKIDIPLILVGNPKAQAGGLIFKNVMCLAEQLGVKDLVRHLGYVADEEMPVLYSMAKALIMPTFFGPTNIPVLEAWAFGCPVLSSDIRGIRQQIGNAGILVNPKDNSALVAGILKLWQDDTLRQTLIARGYEKINSYTQNDFGEKLISIINEVKNRIYEIKNAQSISILKNAELNYISSVEFMNLVSDYFMEYLANKANKNAVQGLQNSRKLLAETIIALGSQELEEVCKERINHICLLFTSCEFRLEKITKEEQELIKNIKDKLKSKYELHHNLFLVLRLYEYYENSYTMPQWLIKDYRYSLFNYSNAYHKVKKKYTYIIDQIWRKLITYFLSKAIITKSYKEYLNYFFKNNYLEHSFLIEENRGQNAGCRKNFLDQNSRYYYYNSRNILEIFNDQVNSLFQESQLLLEECKYAEAINKLDEVMYLDPNLKRLQYLRAKCLLSMDKPHEAKIAAKLELSLQPNFQPALDILRNMSDNN